MGQNRDTVTVPSQQTRGNTFPRQILKTTRTVSQQQIRRFSDLRDEEDSGPNCERGFPVNRRWIVMKVKQTSTDKCKGISTYSVENAANEANINSNNF